MAALLACCRFTLSSWFQHLTQNSKRMHWGKHNQSYLLWAISVTLPALAGYSVSLYVQYSLLVQFHLENSNILRLFCVSRPAIKNACGFSFPKDHCTPSILLLLPCFLSSYSLLLSGKDKKGQKRKHFVAGLGQMKTVLQTVFVLWFVSCISHFSQHLLWTCSDWCEPLTVQHCEFYLADLNQILLVVCTFFFVHKKRKSS